MHPGDDLISAMLYDLDRRQDLVRRFVGQRMAEKGPVASPDHIVATYFAHSRASHLKDVGEAISYHMTTAEHNPPPGSLLAECTGEVLGTDPFDAHDRLGLVWVGFPVKMMRYDDGKVYTTDLLHLAAGEGAFGLCDHADLQLVNLEFPDDVLATFPGPAHGPDGIRRATNWPDGAPMFGTILKPTSGITPREVGDLVRGVAGNPLFGFAKEDENLVPGATFCPLAARAKEAAAAIRERADKRGGRGLLFAPHITAPPALLMGYLAAALEAGLNAVMFSDQFVGGTLRMVREATMNMPNPPAIYAHNGGISVKTRHIWREVLDLLVRLDGADFRQTAPVTTKASLLRPYGQEWLNCEASLTRPLGHIKPVMISRAGGLDQGNIILNLRDAKERGFGDGVLFLAGSAINSVKDASGKASAELGSQAMTEAVEAYETGAVTGEDPQAHVAELYAYALTQNKTALEAALTQRYPSVS
jgi:ribulose 1,5-bisphosphate carboxylase large subunit-like protein